MRLAVLNIVVLLPISAVLMLVGQSAADPQDCRRYAALSILALSLYGLLLCSSMMYRLLAELLDE